jgi:hypothetical protein
MATTEELSVVIKTVADTSGAQQVQRSLNQLTAQQQVANTVLRQSMAQVPQTAAAFQAQARAVEQQVGARPTLLPEDLGIKAAAAATATRAVGEASRFTASEMARFGAATIGLGVGLSAFTFAGQGLHDVMQRIIESYRDFEEAQRNNTLALGQQSAAFQSWAQVVSQQAGETQAALLEAGTAAEQLRRSAGFGPEQAQGLVAVATLLSNIRGQDVGQTMNQLTAAMNGNAQAAQSLGLQLDGAYIAYTQLGGATADVFNQLDPATQTTLRFASALEQLARQVETPQTPLEQLGNAVGVLGANFERIAVTEAPSFIGAAKQLVDLASTLAGAFATADEATVKFTSNINAASHALHDEMAKRVAEVVDQLKNFAALVGTALGDLGNKVNEALPDIGKPIQDLTEGPASQAVTEWADRVGDGFDLISQNVQDLGGAIQSVADQSDRAAQSAAAMRQQQLASLSAEVAAPAAVLAAAQRNEITAARELVNLKYDQVQLGAQEAQIRLAMLPQQERMLELQNELNQAQIEATQRTLPATRQLQDLQNQIRQATLIAQNPDVAMAERQRALVTATGLTRQLPGAELGALQAQMGALPVQRAAEDVQRQAQLQALQQQQALFGPEFLNQQLGLLSQIAEAAKVAAQRTVELTVQGINVILQGTGMQLTDTDYQQIVTLAGQAVADAIHSAVQTVDQRGASSQLLGASSP